MMFHMKFQRLMPAKTYDTNYLQILSNLNNNFVMLSFNLVAIQDL